MTTPPPSYAEIKACWVADLDLVARRDRWGLALGTVGVVHLGFFLTCQVMHNSGDRTAWHYVGLWGGELASTLTVFSAIAGRSWVQSSPLAGLIARIWGTVLILSLSLASMNQLSGLDYEWFKPVLCTLASFGFMMMAYLVSPWFFTGAVWMSLTGVVMVNALNFSYLIHGTSWCLILTVLGTVLEVRRRSLNRRPEQLRIVIPIRNSGHRPSWMNAHHPG